jgi:hypothetical protein
MEEYFCLLYIAHRRAGIFLINFRGILCLRKKRSNATSRIILIVFVVLIFQLTQTNLYLQNACDNASFIPCTSVDVDPDIPPYNRGWICEPLTEIIVEMPNGNVCPACVSYCWRTPYITAPHYQIYLCAFWIDINCAGQEFLNLPWYEKYELIGEAIITNNPNNIFTYVPNCPSSIMEVEVFWSRCWDGQQTCKASNSWCQKVYNVCIQNGEIIHTLLYTQSSPGNNCQPPCRNIDPCN